MIERRYHCVCPKCNQASMQLPSVAMRTGENRKWFLCPHCKTGLMGRLWPDLDSGREMLAEEAGNPQEDAMARQLADQIEI